MRDLHLLVLPSYYPSRYRPYTGTFFRDWTQALRGAGVKVGVAYVEDRALRSLSPRALLETHFQLTSSVEGGVPTLRLAGWNTLTQSTAGGLVWARIAQRVIREYISRYGRPDLVAAQSATWAGQAAWHARRRWKIPYVITEVNTRMGMGSIRGWEAAVTRRAFAGAGAIVAISENLRRQLARLGGARLIEVIPCAVDESFWTLPPAPRAHLPYTFYAQAHLTFRKGFDILIRAFARRFQGDATVRLVIGGGGRIRSDLEALARAVGVESQVSFLGAIPREIVRDAMWNANAFVLPSHAENFGVVLIEALATGLPVISTRCGGPEEILTDEVGILLQPGDEAGLAEALSAMRCGSSYEPEVLRTHAVSRYGYATVGPRLRDFYRSVLDGI
jgi:glycosyltransferase involved in cell wall biosynthesis